MGKITFLAILLGGLFPAPFATAGGAIGVIGDQPRRCSATMFEFDRGDQVQAAIAADKTNGLAIDLSGSSGVSFHSVCQIPAGNLTEMRIGKNRVTMSCWNNQSTPESQLADVELFDGGKATVSWKSGEGVFRLTLSSLEGVPLLPGTLRVSLEREGTLELKTAGEITCSIPPPVE